ncbi:MAG: hypothetical protein ACJAYF_003985 [Arenicella sp.]|jgi:hypothetical protein
MSPIEAENAANSLLLASLGDLGVFPTKSGGIADIFIRSSNYAGVSSYLCFDFVAK